MIEEGNNYKQTDRRQTYRQTDTDKDRKREKERERERERCHKMANKSRAGEHMN